MKRGQLEIFTFVLIGLIATGGLWYASKGPVSHAVLGRAVETPYCKDSDATTEYPNGKNIFVQGTITGPWAGNINGPMDKQIDYCIDASLLQEYLCVPSDPKNPDSPQGIGQQGYSCPAGTSCKGGACMKATTTLTCTDSDSGKNYDVKGIITDGTHKFSDLCMDDQGNPQMANLGEYYCDAAGSIIQLGYHCPNGCKNGACVAALAPQPGCVDSDGGWNLNMKGDAAMGGKVVCTDRCATEQELKNSGGRDQLFECFCGNKQGSGGGQGSGWTGCPAGTSCSNGACVPAPVAPLPPILPDQTIPLRTASILDVPLPENAKCFYDITAHQELPECEKFYKLVCQKDACKKAFACPRFYNPVYDANGIFYPSACWAEQLGATKYKYGISNRLIQFFRDLWYTPKTKNDLIINSYDVPRPDIEFSYAGGRDVAREGGFLRSILWQNSHFYEMLDYEAITKAPRMRFPTDTFVPVYGTTLKTLIVFVPFDAGYPEQVLIDWANRYEPIINDYIQKKQKVSKPARYDFIPVVIAPPTGMKPSSLSDTSFRNEDIQKIYKTAITNLGQDDFNVFVIVPVVFQNRPSGIPPGVYHWEGGMNMIVSWLQFNEPYSEADVQKGLTALSAFQSMLYIITHEILHSLGLNSDHFPLEYSALLQTSAVDPVTGKERTAISECDFIGTSPDYYGVEVPDNLKIYVGKEPSGATKIKSASGPCLTGAGAFLKDYGNDGDYEIVYNNWLIGLELQRALGWVDIDGDGITEIIDSTPYGGYTLHTGYTITGSLLDESSFQPLGKVTIGNCIFEQIKLENGQKGLVPLQCAEFNQDIVNLYREAKYQWLHVSKPYGDVFLAKLPQIF